VSLLDKFFFAAQSEFVSYSVPIVTHDIRRYLTSWPATPFGEAPLHQITHCVLRGRWSEWTHGVSASSCPPINSFIDENMLPFKNGSPGTKQEKLLNIDVVQQLRPSSALLVILQQPPLHHAPARCRDCCTRLFVNCCSSNPVSSYGATCHAVSYILISTLSSRTCARCLWQRFQVRSSPTSLSV